MTTKTLRGYQSSAVEASAGALMVDKRVVVVAPTGSGKSLMIAAIAKRAMEKGLRVLVLAPKGFLLEQNEAEFLEFCGIDPLMGSSMSGVYCAGLNRKDTNKQIIFASRDSLGNSPDACGFFDLILCDECHGIPLDVLNQYGQYHKIFTHQMVDGKEPYVIGFTATPWRLDGGLIYGIDKFFKRSSYAIGLHYLIECGFLSRYHFPDHTKVDNSFVDLSGCKIVRGDYQERDLDVIMGDFENIEKCIDIWLENAVFGSDLIGCTLFFCVSIYHAKRFMERLVVRFEKLGLPHDSICYIDGSIIGKEREKVLNDIREGVYSCVINIGVLTEGFDAPVIDCVMFLRPTASASLFVQMAGRGLRPRQSKDSCLFLDVAGNFERFKSIDDPIVEPPQRSQKTKDEIDMPVDLTERECMQCGATIPAGSARCHECYDFRDRELDVVHDPFDLRPITYRVRSTHIEDYITKNGEDAKLIHYITEGGHFKQYLLINREGRYGNTARYKYSELTNLQMSPKSLKITNNKTKYPDIKIVDWINNKRYNNPDCDKCKHPFVETIFSISGHFSTVCLCCSEQVF